MIAVIQLSPRYGGLHVDALFETIQPTRDFPLHKVFIFYSAAIQDADEPQRRKVLQTPYAHACP
jgi:hypothetical protein